MAFPESLGAAFLGLLSASAGGAEPAAATPPAVLPDYSAYILTPTPGPLPRLTGPRVFGVRPGHPVVFRVTATGERPLTFSADSLPSGLTLDAETGRLSGAIATAGDYRVVVHVRNARGNAERTLRLAVGEAIALTPPLGWNSWNSWAADVDQDKILASAIAMVTTGLADHGWSYVNCDDTWEGKRGGPHHAILPNAKFPNMKALAGQIHELGLKFGIYSTPFVTTYGGYNGGTSDNPKGDWEPGPKGSGREIGRYSFAAEDVAEWNDWGVDYLKYDWFPIDLANALAMSRALRHGSRDIVLSLSNAAPLAEAHALQEVAQLWRTGKDIRDEWRGPWPNQRSNQSIADIWEFHPAWRRYDGPGHWNDPDMLVVGMVGWSKNLRPTHLTADEQFTHISLWCLWSAPLLIGSPLDRLDPFTLSLLTNDEVLDVDQDPLGHQAVLVAKDNLVEVWAKTLEDGSRAVGLFNRGETPETVRVTWRQLGLEGSQPVRDLWRQQDVGVRRNGYAATVRSHGVVLVRIGVK